MQRLIPRRTCEIYELEREIKRLQNWVDDLQSGMYVNCVYCGFRYGPKDKVPCTMAQALKDHIEKCEQHPMSFLKKENEKLKKLNLELSEALRTFKDVIDTLVK